MVASGPIVVLDNGRELSFSFDEMLKYHGGGSPGGVAHAFKVLQRALSLLDPDGRVERRERFVFRLRYRDRAVTLMLREGFVTDEFVDLTRREGRSTDEERELAAMKADMATRVMAAAAAAVYDVASAA
jgi:hypothetical protein